METLKAIARTKSGTRHTRKLRDEGMIPGIIYGHGLEPVSFAVPTREMNLALQHGERLIQLELDGKTENYLIKDVQHDAFGAHVIHVDFTRVNLDETVEVTVPVILRGTPVGAAEGGVLAAGLSELDIKCVVTAIPEEIKVKVGDMKIGDVIYVSDLPAMEGVTILNDADAIIASCQTIAEEAAAPAAEGEEVAQPEVIGKGKKEEEEGEE